MRFNTKVRFHKFHLNHKQVSNKKISIFLLKRTMEVHKHSHHETHKKKWTAYLLEFFMLFLAVFLGFVAENIREERVEHKRAHEFADRLLADLTNDTSWFNKEINRIERQRPHMDEAIQLLIQPVPAT